MVVGLQRVDCVVGAFGGNGEFGTEIDLFDLMSPWARVVSLRGSSSETSI